MIPPAPVAHSVWVCGTLCRRSSLPWSCRRWCVLLAPVSKSVTEACDR